MFHSQPAGARTVQPLRAHSPTRVVTAARLPSGTGYCLTQTGLASPVSILTCELGRRHLALMGMLALSLNTDLHSSAIPSSPTVAGSSDLAPVGSSTSKSDVSLSSSDPLDPTTGQVKGTFWTE
jgi:hypothetical protein